MNCDPLSCGLAAFAGLTFVIWVYLIVLHHGFWRADQRLPSEAVWTRPWPAVVVLVPARDEEAVIADSLTSLLEQDYPGDYRVVLIDDHSSDGTSDQAKTTAAACSRGSRLSLTKAPDLPVGWSGKLWALNEGLALVAREWPETPYVWFSDADIAHKPDTLRRLVAKAEQDDRVLVSLMAQLACERFWERILIPPFIYFFQKLYPFPAVNDPRSGIAGAAGGCALLRRAVLEQAGGLAAIRGALIDDCTLGRLMKQAAPPHSRGIWLGLSTGESRSLRPYDDLASIWDMVARSAYTQLRHSPLLLVGSLIGMALTYLAAPLIALVAWPLGAPLAGALALAACCLMLASFLPTLWLFGLSPWRALLLPFAALLYSAMTFSSAWRSWRGRGGQWKGRTQAGLEQEETSG